MIKLIVTAMLSFGVGAGGTYAVVHTTATCSAPAITQDEAPNTFFAKPDAPLTGWKRY